MKKEIEIGNKKYTLTANRSIIKTLYEIAPSVLEINATKRGQQNEIKVGLDLMANLDVLFFQMIKVAHSNITKEKSDEILEQFEKEYEGVQEALLELALSVFQQGDQKKKKIDW